jgi:acetoin utilization deacetylase AcuC-like enzyme
VHHGNGTQDVFEERSDVLYASLHGWPLYPGTGAAAETGRGAGRGFTVNVPLPAGTADEAWLAALDARVMPALRSFRPDVVLASVGFDADRRDPLGNLALTPRAYGEAMARLVSVAPTASVLEGGYDLAAVEEGTAETCDALAGERRQQAP